MKNTWNNDLLKIRKKINFSNNRLCGKERGDFRCNNSGDLVALIYGSKHFSIPSRLIEFVWDFIGKQTFPSTTCLRT